MSPLINLEEIKNPEFLKTLSKKELVELAEQIRQFLIANISKTGGHLASNLGVVELTIALHYIFKSPQDKLIFDVGHQIYTHKILTGRASEFKNLRKFNGLSGFASYRESEHDVWESGHSSTSLSAQAGFLLAQKEGKNIGRTCVLIGDSSMVNGVSFEALNYMGTIKKTNPIIILNDNKMGISQSVGTMTKVFLKLRSSSFYRNFKKFLIKILPSFLLNICHRIKSSIKSLFQTTNIFESMGYDYYGPYNGNDLDLTIKVLRRMNRINKPVVIHFITTKGKGYVPAEEDESGLYHSVTPFDIQTGKVKNENIKVVSYSSLAAEALTRLRRKQKLFVISPAMISGSELNGFEQEFPNELIDVGIAEEHAAVMAGAMRLNKLDVALMYYSTFAQRAYDEILNDIARPNLRVVIGLDRADLVPGDGSTHQGIYDISMFSGMPHVKIVAPSTPEEMLSLFEYAFQQDNPIAIRYPKQCVEVDLDKLKAEKVLPFKWKKIKEGNALTIISYGPKVNRIKELVVKENLDVEVVNAMFIRPFDVTMFEEILQKNKPLIVYENVIHSSSLGEKLITYGALKGYDVSKIKLIAIPDDAKVPTGSINDLLKLYHLDDEALLKEIKNLL